MTFRSIFIGVCRALSPFDVDAAATAEKNAEAAVVMFRQLHIRTFVY